MTTTQKLEEKVLATNHKARQNNRWMLGTFLAGFTILMVLIVVGLLYQNYLARKNTEHIDCILKTLATPPPPGTPPNARKYVANLETDCQVKFTQ